MVYTYKGVFNYIIDYDWTGGVLVDFQKVIDQCNKGGSPNVQPAPFINGGDLFDKVSPYNHVTN